MRSSLGLSFLFILILQACASVHSAPWVDSHTKRFAATSSLLALAAAFDIVKCDDANKCKKGPDTRPFFKKLRNRSGALCSPRNWMRLVCQATDLCTAPEEEDKNFFKKVRFFVKNHKLLTTAFVICSINAGISVVQLINEFKKSVRLQAPAVTSKQQVDTELPSSESIPVSDVHAADEHAVVDENPLLAVVEPVVVTTPELVVVASEGDQPSESDRTESSPEKYAPQRSLRGQRSYQDGPYVVTADMLSKVMQPGRRRSHLRIRTGKDIPDGIQITKGPRRRTTRPRSTQKASVAPWTLATEEVTTTSESSVSPWVRRRPSPRVLATPVVYKSQLEGLLAPQRERVFEDATNTSITTIPIDFSSAMELHKPAAPQKNKEKTRRATAGDSENKRPVVGKRSSVSSRSSTRSVRQLVQVPFGSTAPRFL